MLSQNPSDKPCSHSEGYDRVHDRIAGYLREQGERQAISRYRSLLTSHADISGSDLMGADAPLAP